MNRVSVPTSQTACLGYSPKSRILIVDDDAFIRQLFAQVIKRMQLGCTVALAENGHEAWQWYQQYGTDLLITDIDMPVMDGIALTKAVRREQPGLPVIMISGSANVQHQACAAGATLFLRKPIKVDCLLQRVRQLLALDAGT